MTSSVGIVSAALGAISSPTVAAPAAAAPSLTTSFADQSGASNLTSGKDSTLIHDPRVTLDPSAGFITQYLSANGSQVVAQSPSAITVAYLRLGLTANGLTKEAASEISLHTSTQA